ncbi:MAG: FIST signal transduction protein [Acidimicrobiales bacterium]
MELKTLVWAPGEGWSASVAALADLDGPRTLVLAFAASELVDAPAPLHELARTFPRSVIMGCSTAGEIRGDLVGDGSVSVAVARFARARLSPVHALASGGAYAAGRSIAEQLGGAGDSAGDSTAELRGVFVLSDGLAVNGSDLARGLSAGLAPGVTITGGLAADGSRFARTWVLVDGEPVEGAISAVGLAGAGLTVGHGTGGGWEIFGPERTVTRAEGNVLYELDGKPALALYKTYLGERASGLPATALLFPLAVRSAHSAAAALVRTVLAVDEADQSMTFAGDIPEGGRAQLMHAGFERLVHGAHAAAAAVERGGEGPTLAVGISCVGRRLALGERVEEELEAVTAALPAGAEVVGFYSYGEISPFGFSSCELHNQTMTVTTLREAEGAAGS